MKTLRETAKDYEPPQGYKNIAELNKLNVDVEIKTNTSIDGNGKEFEYFYCEVDGQEYRIPKSVLSDLKVLIEEIPTLQYIKVTKKGEGMGTKYNVIPLPN